MKKSLVVLAISGAVAGAAHAQSHISIYGTVDTGFIKKSGHDVGMGENVENQLGFSGVEDLGGGLKATFDLEKRFELRDGTGIGTTAAGKNREFEGMANVGLKSARWGAVILGRVNDMATETIREFDPFYQYGVGGMLESHQRAEGLDSTVRYDSPEWNGFRFGATYSLGGNTDKDSVEGYMAGVKGAGADNDGYAMMVGYDNGALSLVGNWERLADSKKSSLWNLGAAYRFGDAKIELVYQQTKDKGWANGEHSNWNDNGSDFGEWFSGKYGADVVGSDGHDRLFNSLTEKQWLLGLEWQFGRGRLNASVQWIEVEGHGGMANGDADVYKYAVGYTYDLSKRTSLYGVIAYTDYEDDAVARMYGDADEGTAAVQVGITHKF